MKLSVISPMYNEAANVIRTYERITYELDKYDFTDRELIFVNDGSTDDSWEIAKSLAKEKGDLFVLGYTRNQGRGKAIRTGFSHAKGDILITTDFDLSYDPSHITRMIQALEAHPEIDVVLTSCYMPGGKTVNVSRVRLWMSRLGNYLLRFAFYPRIYTSTCVVRAYRKHVIDELVLESDRKEIHLEILSKVITYGFQILEIPGTLKKRTQGRSSFKFRTTSLSHLLFLIHERPFLLFGSFGLILLFMGILAGFIITYARFLAPPGFADTFLGTLVSPNFVIILFLSGLQVIGLGFLGIQNNLLKKELFKIQRQLHKQNNSKN